MSNLAKFKTRLAAYAQDKDGLPNVVLKQDTDIGQAFSSVTIVDNRVQGEGHSDVAARYVDEFCAALTGENNRGAVELFDQTVEAFSGKIKTAMTALSGIREKARTLAADMEKSCADILAKDEFYGKYVNYGQMSEDFPVFDWAASKVWGSKNELAKAVNGLIVVDGSNVPEDCDERLFNIIISDLDRWAVAPVVNIDEEGRKTAIDALKVACPDLPEATIAQSFDQITGIAKYLSTYGILSNRKNMPAVDLFTNICILDKFVLDNYTVADAIITGAVKVADNLQEGVMAGAKALQRFCMIASYYEMMQRETIFRDAFLLQSGMINADTKDAYTSAGGTTKMVANYIRKMYKDERNFIPAMGVKGDAIINADKTIADQVAEDIKTTMGKVAIAKTNAHVYAFNLVAREFVTQRYNDMHKDDGTVNMGLRTTQVNNILSSVGSKVADSIRQYNAPFVEAAINLVIGVEYAGTFVEHLQKKLGAAYLSLANLNTEVSAKDIRCAEVGVIAELIAAFIVDEVTEASPCTEPEPLPAPAVPSESQPAEQTPVTTPAEVKEEPGAAPATEQS